MPGKRTVEDADYKRGGCDSSRNLRSRVRPDTHRDDQQDGRRGGGAAHAFGLDAQEKGNRAPQRS
jgi:hypothetical protein